MNYKCDVSEVAGAHPGCTEFCAKSMSLSSENRASNHPSEASHTDPVFAKFGTRTIPEAAPSLAIMARGLALYFLAIVYSPEQSQVTVWSGLAVPLQVPVAFAPFSFPTPSRKAHLSLPACKAPFFKVPVIW